MLVKQEQKGAEQTCYLLHVSLKYVVLFFGLLDLLCKLIFGLVQLLVQSLVSTLQLGQLLQNVTGTKLFD